MSISKLFTDLNNCSQTWKIRLPIGQPSGKIQVAPIKIQVAPFVNYIVYDDCAAHSRMKWNIIGMRSVENNEKQLYFRKKS